MRNYRQSGRRPCAVAVFCLLVSAWAGAATVIDRIVATVNQRVILQSQWDEVVRFESLVDGRPLEQITPAQRKQALERLIDQELIQEEMRNSSYVAASAEEVATRVRDLRETNPAWKSDEGWRAALVGAGLSQQDVEERMAVQANLLRYLDRRFRPDVHIDRKAIDRYYLEQLLPQLHRAGAPEVPLQDVSGKIERLLIEQRLNDIQEQWVRGLRAQAEIDMR